MLSNKMNDKYPTILRRLVLELEKAPYTFTNDEKVKVYEAVERYMRRPDNVTLSSMEEELFTLKFQTILPDKVDAILKEIETEKQRKEVERIRQKQELDKKEFDRKVQRYIRESVDSHVEYAKQVTCEENKIWNNMIKEFKNRESYLNEYGDMIIETIKGSYRLPEEEEVSPQYIYVDCEYNICYIWMGSHYWSTDEWPWIYEYIKYNDQKKLDYGYY